MTRQTAAHADTPSQEALRQSEARYRSLFENMFEGLAHCRMLFEQGVPQDFIYLEVNRAFEKLTGLKNVVGKRVTEVIPGIKESHPELFQAYARVALSGRPERLEIYLAALKAWFSISVYSTEQGCFTAVFENVTERRHAGEAIGSSRAELEAIYDSTPFMMCVVNRSRQVERMNRSMAEFVGDRPASDSRQERGHVLGCVSALDDARGCGFGTQCQICPLRLAVARTFETGEPCRQVEATMLLARGGARHQLQVSASTALVRLRDEVKVLVCLEDITSRKQVEAQFLQAQKMEVVGQLASGVAHDFNNILAAALLHLQLLQESDKLEPEMKESLCELEQGTQRAASLTRQLLLFSRRQPMQTRRVDLNEVVQGLLKMLRRVLSEDVETVFSPGPEPVWVEADVGMLEQVVMNLCINARDAMPQGGRLELGVRRVRVGAAEVGDRPQARPGKFACLTATDSGCGMDEATLSRIFEPFFTTKEPGHGTGLGLATVRGVTRQHHGWVEVESVVGHGTSFHIFLPAVEPPTSREIQAKKARPRGGTETILLVEDDERVRRTVRMTLRVFGYEVLEASDAVGALRLWESHAGQVGLLFTDMVLPGAFSGLELAQRLRQFKPGLKVIISSGYAADLLQQAGGLPTGMRFLAKPYEPNSLASTVRECLDQGR